MKKILLADDEPLIHTPAREYLSRAGCNTSSVHSNIEAALWLADNPDVTLIILDQGCLAGGGVVDLARQMAPDVRIILWTGGIVGKIQVKVSHVDMIVPKDGYVLGLLTAVRELLF